MNTPDHQGEDLPRASLDEFPTEELEVIPIIIGETTQAFLDSQVPIGETSNANMSPDQPVDETPVVRSPEARLGHHG